MFLEKKSIENIVDRIAIKGNLGKATGKKISCLKDPIENNDKQLIELVFI